jgi:CheY-like chemotaxis protein
MPVKKKHSRSKSARRTLPAEGTGELILLVDDEPTTRSLRKWLLEEYGYRVIEAENGRLGVEAAIRERPRLIFMNYLMPEMNGLQAIEEIRRTPGLEQIPIIMNSACLEEEMRAVAIAAGCVDYVEEPFDFDELVEKVSLHIRAG